MPVAVKNTGEGRVCCADRHPAAQCGVKVNIGIVAFVERIVAVCTTRPGRAVSVIVEVEVINQLITAEEDAVSVEVDRAVGGGAARTAGGASGCGLATSAAAAGEVVTHEVQMPPRGDFNQPVVVFVHIYRYYKNAERDGCKQTAGVGDLHGERGGGLGGGCDGVGQHAVGGKLHICWRVAVDAVGVEGRSAPVCSGERDHLASGVDEVVVVGAVVGKVDRRDGGDGERDGECSLAIPRVESEVDFLAINAGGGGGRKDELFSHARAVQGQMCRDGGSDGVVAHPAGEGKGERGVGGGVDDGQRYRHTAGERNRRGNASKPGLRAAVGENGL